MVERRQVRAEDDQLTKTEEACEDLIGADRDDHGGPNGNDQVDAFDVECLRLQHAQDSGRGRFQRDTQKIPPAGPKSIRKSFGNVAETLRIGKTVTDWSRAGQARGRDPCRY